MNIQYHKNFMTFNKRNPIKLGLGFNKQKRNLIKKIF